MKGYLNMRKSTLDKMKFMEDYVNATNASTGSKYDANANITVKNIATLSYELPKKDNIDLQRAVMHKYLTKLYDENIANQYEIDLNNHIIYAHDESGGSGGFPYCCSISLYPFLINGLKDLGGNSSAPLHANSYIGGLINLIFLVAGQFVGAVAIPEFLTYFDYFLRKDYGENYLDYLDVPIETIGSRKQTLRGKITDWFQQLVYTVNEPASARGYQSVFINIAYFDKYYFESMFKDFVFPDGCTPKWETTKEIQKLFMKWFNKERTKTVLTFPVETMNILVENGEYKDKETADFASEMWSEGASFFMYQSDSVDSLSSCCRLRNAVEENIFSYTLGAGGIETGSKRVITLNINRITQDWYKVKNEISLKDYIAQIVERVHKYLIAYNEKLWDDYNNNILTVYKAELIHLDKQYLTIGINGFVEGAEFLEIPIDYRNTQYQQYAKDILETIKELNTKNRTKRAKFNTEFVPAENLGVKNYNWDKKDGYVVPQGRNLYNSYFYIVEDETIDPVKKFYYQGHNFIDCLDGGSALHNNLDSHLTKKQYRLLMDVAIKSGCNYFTYNIPNTVCNECGHIDKRKLNECPVCHSSNVDYATRVIGYLKRISNFSEARQKEASKRYYATEDKVKEN